MKRYILGKILQLAGLFLLCPTAVALIYQEGAQILYAYSGTALASVLVGTLFSLKKPTVRKLNDRDGLTIVSLTWFLLTLVGAIPMTLCGDIPSYVDALFEAASGFTTTGSSILENVEIISHATQFWRSFAHLVGGMGVLVFAMAILPKLGSETVQLMKAEVPGVTFGKVKARLHDTALVLYLLYFLLTLLLTLALRLAGMNWFDAIIHGMGTAGTGGFSNKAASIAYYQSPLIEWIITVGMTLFGVNFALYYQWLKSKGKKWIRDEELYWYLGIIVAAALLCTACQYPTYTHSGGTLTDSLRTSFFTVSSMITTTGYGTADFNLWPALAKNVLCLLMFFGACTGSTGGGLKIFRIGVLFKSALSAARGAKDPNRAIPIRFDEKPLTDDTVKKVLRYFALYCLTFIICLLLVSLDNVTFEEGFTAVVATLNNIGPGLGRVGPTGSFAFLSPFSKIVLTVGMIAGRLEIYPVIALLNRSAWKAHHSRQ